MTRERRITDTNLILQFETALRVAANTKLWILIGIMLSVRKTRKNVYERGQREFYSAVDGK